LADIEWIEMAERMKGLPLVVLAAVTILAVLLYWVSRRPLERPEDLGRRDADVPAAPAPAPEPAQGAPPPATNPGEKILEGADRAFQKEMYETSLKFYKDFELRYAGTEVYDRNLTRIWERIHTSGAKMPKKDPDLPAYLEARRKLAGEWKRIQPLLEAPPTDESKAEVEKFAASLPPADGRLKRIDPWRDGKK
jgi:hypothetical protein